MYIILECEKHGRKFIADLFWTESSNYCISEAFNYDHKYIWLHPMIFLPINLLFHHLHTASTSFNVSPPSLSLLPAGCLSILRSVLS